MNYQREKSKMDKKEFIKDLLPDLLELIERKLESNEQKEPKAKTKTKRATKKKAATKKRATNKRGTTTRKAKVSKAVATKSQPTVKTKVKPNPDFPQCKFVDDLSVDPHLIELDKIVCKRGPRTPRSAKKTSTKTCGLSTDENGNKVDIGGCGKKFDSSGSYLCDRCLEGKGKNAE